MVVAGVASRLLSLLGYPRFLKRLPGDYRVGALRTRLPSSLTCQVFYPVDRGASGERAPYWRSEAADGLASYSQMPPALFGVLTRKRHPCALGAPPLASPGAWPIAVFSPGLGGCAEMYSQLCVALASHGLVVVSLEHEDGSGCYARTADGETLTHKVPTAAVAPTRDGCVEFRAPFLAKRRAELLTVIAALSSADDAALSAPLAAVLNAADRGGVHLVGHSFGAAGAASLLHAAHWVKIQGGDGGGEGELPNDAVRSVALLDPWTRPLPDAVLDGGALTVGPPALCVLSGAWANDTTGDSLTNIGRLMAGWSEDGVTVHQLAGTQHQSISDTPTWTPRYVARKFGAIGPRERPATTHTAMADALSAHIEFAEVAAGRRDGSAAAAAARRVRTLAPVAFPYAFPTAGGDVPRAEDADRSGVRVESVALRVE